MKPSRLPAPRRRPMLFGPGTVMALVAALYLVGSGWTSPRRPTIPDGGRVVYEADTRGHLRRVEAPSQPLPSRQVLPPLWKPEVGLLRQRASSLHLTEHQSRLVVALDAAWQRDRTALRQASADAAAPVLARLAAPRAGSSASVAQIQQGLAGYAELSRQYDVRRAAYWAQGLAALTPSQRAQATALASGPREGAPR